MKPLLSSKVSLLPTVLASAFVFGWNEKLASVTTEFLSLGLHKPSNCLRTPMLNERVDR